MIFPTGYMCIRFCLCVCSVFAQSQKEMFVFNNSKPDELYLLTLASVCCLGKRAKSETIVSYFGGRQGRLTFLSSRKKIYRYLHYSLFSVWVLLPNSQTVYFTLENSTSCNCLKWIAGYYCPDLADFLMIKIARNKLISILHGVYSPNKD